jgi:hypothetical protein
MTDGRFRAGLRQETMKITVKRDAKAVFPGCPFQNLVI